MLAPVAKIKGALGRKRDALVVGLAVVGILGVADAVFRYQCTLELIAVVAFDVGGLEQGIPHVSRGAQRVFIVVRCFEGPKTERSWGRFGACNPGGVPVRTCEGLQE